MFRYKQHPKTYLCHVENCTRWTGGIVVLFVLRLCAALIATYCVQQGLRMVSRNEGETWGGWGCTLFVSGSEGSS